MLKDKIKAYAKVIGIDLIGFTDAEINPILESKLKLQKDLDLVCEFQKGSIDERTNPKLLMENCKTIIAIALAYPKTCDKLENISTDEVYFSASSWGADYHKVLKEKMLLLVNYIQREVPSLNYKIICDISPLCDRTIAYQAGLGFFGRNHLLINPDYGSYIFLGSILTDLDIEKDKPITLYCSNCNKCVEACPAGALDNEDVLNYKKCLAYLTQKKELRDTDSKLMNQCIYGCDICMSVCPYNKQNNNHHKEFTPSGIEFININEYKPLSNRQFKKYYGKLSGSWRGVKIINRNIKICKNKLK